MATASVPNLNAVRTWRRIEHVEREYARIAADPALKDAVGEEVLTALCERYEKLGGNLEHLAQYDGAPSKPMAPLAYHPAAKPARTEELLRTPTQPIWEQRSGETRDEYHRRLVASWRSAPESTTGKNALAALIDNNMGYARTMAAQYHKGTSRGVPFEDLVQAAIIGLIEGAKRFDRNNRGTYDGDRSAKYLTYAAWWMKRELLNCISDFRSGHHMPKHRMQDIRNTLKQGEGSMVAERKKYHRALLEKEGTIAISLNTPIRGNDGKQRTIEDTIPNPDWNEQTTIVSAFAEQLRQSLGAEIEAFRAELGDWRAQYIFTKRVTIATELLETLGIAHIAGIGSEATSLQELSVEISKIPKYLPLAETNITIAKGKREKITWAPGGALIRHHHLTRERVRQIETRILETAVRQGFLIRKTNFGAPEIDIEAFLKGKELHRPR